MKRVSAIIVTVTVLLVGGGWAQNTPTPTNTLEEIVARVNNEIILKSELDRALKELRDELGDAGVTGVRLDQEFATRSKDMLRDLIDQSLLMQVAKDQGLSADIEVIKAMEKLRQENKLESMDALEKAIIAQGSDIDDFKQNIRTRYLTSQVIQREVRVTVTNEDVRNYYDAHKAEFDRPAGVQLEEITVYTQGKSPADAAAQRKKIDDALAAARNGENFNDLAA